MIELNKIIHADCMDIIKDIPDKYFELAIVDPPYGYYKNTQNLGIKLLILILVLEAVQLPVI